MTELPVQQLIRLDAGSLNNPLWRNNSGAFKTPTGRWVRFGLGNDSEAVNAVMKSSDLIGGTRTFITPDMVGKTLFVFTAVECKPPDWHMIPSDDRAKAQLTFIELVRRHGGLAGFATSVDDYRKIIGR